MPVAVSRWELFLRNLSSIDDTVWLQVGKGLPSLKPVLDKLLIKTRECNHKMIA